MNEDKLVSYLSSLPRTDLETVLDRVITDNMDTDMRRELIDVLQDGGKEELADTYIDMLGTDESRNVLYSLLEATELTEELTDWILSNKPSDTVLTAFAGSLWENRYDVLKEYPDVITDLENVLAWMKAGK